QVGSPWAPDETRTSVNRLAATLMDLVENESASRTSYLSKNSTAMAFFADAVYCPLTEQFVALEKQKWNDLPTLHGEDEPTARLIQKSIEGVYSWIVGGGLEDQVGFNISRAMKLSGRPFALSFSVTVNRLLVDAEQPPG
ncbi:hypothetical protein FOZ63_025200, partial [Perkinsus olseni]